MVFGDIGTSPIYALKECFSPHSAHHVPVTTENVLGVVSLVLWALLTLVCLKYLAFILRADNRGEGGVLSLMALATHGMGEMAKRRAAVVLLGLCGAAMLFGDGVITPAISVLSAVEGLKEGGLLGARPVDAEALGRNFWRVTGRFGFMQKPDVPRLLRQCAAHGLALEPDQTTFFLGREIIIPSRSSGMARWRARLFGLAGKLAQQPASYFQIPVGRVIELGQQVEI